MKSLVKKLFGAAGFEISYADNRRRFPDLSDDILNTIAIAKPFTMTSVDRLAALCSAIEYVTKYGIEGDFVECGVWKGGSCIAAASTFLRVGNPVPIWLFDTFEGMSEPTEFDKAANSGETASALMAKETVDKTSIHSVKAYSSLDEVKRNLQVVNYPNFKFVQGRVEDTIPANIPEKISILRLDTDWYESTKHELTHLFPRLAKGGVLIIDDYGFWEGARRAVDEYFAASPEPMLLNRIDVTGRIGIKL